MSDLFTILGTDPAPGERLDLSEYHHDFRKRDEAIVNRDSWKLERRQHFEEQRGGSRDALRRGDWVEALRLIEAKRDQLVKTEREENARGHYFHRVRVVEQPITAYMQWQLHSLRLRDECGERVRVVAAEKVWPLERAGVLPELVVLGGQVLYEVRYTDAGVPDGAVRYTNPGVVARAEEFLCGLYGEGEDIQSYFAREVAPLPPPRLEPMTE
jgi:hypothetical protein